MFFTYEGVHINMAYVSGFGWRDGNLQITNNAGVLDRIPDPDRSLYLQMCEKAGVMPEVPKEEV